MEDIHMEEDHAEESPHRRSPSHSQGSHSSERLRRSPESLGNIAQSSVNSGSPDTTHIKQDSVSSSVPSSSVSGPPTIHNDVIPRQVREELMRRRHLTVPTLLPLQLSLPTLDIRPHELNNREARRAKFRVWDTCLNALLSAYYLHDGPGYLEEADEGYMSDGRNMDELLKVWTHRQEIIQLILDSVKGSVAVMTSMKMRDWDPYNRYPRHIYLKVIEAMTYNSPAEEHFLKDDLRAICTIWGS
ncbi:hypothetical protein QBC44DRAFT_368667 [Cladorrhinum sp. PSN332]|nr:hypothetical protein QBC44DRAFT_368667 [Cladorrhinum sp. PSN332]